VCREWDVHSIIPEGGLAEGENLRGVTLTGEADDTGSSEDGLTIY
jgi:hypothetical protein